MLKIINKVLIGIKAVWLSVKVSKLAKGEPGSRSQSDLGNAQKRADLRGFFKNPLFYFCWRNTAPRAQSIEPAPERSGGRKHKFSNFVKFFVEQKNNIFTKLRKALPFGSAPTFDVGIFYFGLVSIVLFSAMYASCDNSISANNLGDNHVVFFSSFFNESSNLSGDDLFSSRANAIPLETPDLKIMQNNTLCGVATPCVVSGKVLGDVFGGNNQNQKDVVDYTVQPGDTLQSIANSYKISINTLLWANDLVSSSTIKVGQSLAILPVDGVLHIVKKDDTISGIAQTYKAQSQDMVSYNNLADQGSKLYIGDILIVPGGVMPKNSSPIINNQIPLADNFFIFPTQGRITQGLHYYNAVDIANKCGTPIYAAAAGIVQRAVSNGGWNGGMGNYITIRHSNGTVTYYGHLMTLLIKPGDSVYTGQNIAFMGGAPGMFGAGNSTGCHLHFQVVGSRNPLTAYLKGATISYK